MDPTGLSKPLIDQWGALGAIIVAFGFFAYLVFIMMRARVDANDKASHEREIAMSQQIKENDIAAQNREKEMAARINALESKMLDEVMEVVRASHQLMVETKVALASNTEAMNHLCHKIDTNFGVKKV